MENEQQPPAMAPVNVPRPVRLTLTFEDGSAFDMEIPEGSTVEYRVNDKALGRHGHYSRGFVRRGYVVKWKGPREEVGEEEYGRVEHAQRNRRGRP